MEGPIRVGKMTVAGDGQAAVAANLRALGHTVEIDDAALAEMSAYFEDLALAEGLPRGVPSDFDESYFHHQIPGGMLTTMKRQLAEIRQLDKLPAVFEETARVREELGFPIMVTPFPQMVCTQALFNVVGAKRYGQVSDQVVRYVLGKFGRPTRPVDDAVKAAILDRETIERISTRNLKRIRYADNETNYCAGCQTGGKVLADRGLSRLLGADWPRTLEELENLQTRR